MVMPLSRLEEDESYKNMLIIKDIIGHAMAIKKQRLSADRLTEGPKNLSSRINRRSIL